MRPSFPLLALLVFTPLSVHADAWKEYQCTFVTDKYHDGDSFYAKAHTGYRYIFRLYGADCPETDTRIASRIEEQAKYFGISEEAVLRWGEKAKKHTENFLKSAFTVHTRKQEARSASGQNRYYAIVLAGDKRLAESLIENGLARAYGMGVPWPIDGRDDVDDFMRRLKHLESKAKRDRIGIWSESKR